jgi:hypothetical protein
MERDTEIKMTEMPVMKKTSYKTNSWWNHRMVNGMNPNRNIDTWEDKEQDKVLKQLESKRKKVEKSSK